ncbi:MAG: prepilin-type N-terminal cleavage/methylation domain-containing protein [Candidatus Binatia bacterium]
MPRSNSSRSHGGFTLIELIIVLVIAAAAAALVMPSVGAGSRQREVRRSLQHFVAAVRTASLQAVTRRERALLAVWPAEGTFAVTDREPGSATDDEAGGETSFDRAARLPDFANFGAIGGGRYLQEDALRGDVVIFDFTPSGGSSGGSIEINYHLRDGSQSYVLTINPLISTVAVEEGE